MFEKRLNEIKERKTAILTELANADEKRVAELNTEVTALDAEAAQLRSKMDLAGKLGKAEDKPAARAEANESEKRGKALLEKRSVTIASTGVIIPAYQASDIKPTFNEVSSLIDNVSIKPFNGGESFKQPYLVGYGTGGYTTEGGSPTDAEPTFGYAEVTKTKITAYAEDSEELTKLPAANYDAEVVKGISTAVRKKITAEILVGDGTSGHFVGIFDDDATAIDAATDIDFAAIDEETLDEIIYSYGGDENVEDVAVLVLNKSDLKAFAMLRDANGRKIHDVKPRGNSGTIDGVPYIINSACKAISATATISGQYAMAYGPLSNYTMAIFSDLEVSRSTDYKFKEGMIAHRGVIFAGGNVTAKNGFLRVKRT
jgi:HK97 family phage major capsid protein